MEPWWDRPFPGEGWRIEIDPETGVVSEYYKRYLWLAPFRGTRLDALARGLRIHTDARLIDSIGHRTARVPNPLPTPSGARSESRD